MADYSTIKGFTIQSLASDPLENAVLGGTWASGGNLATGRSGAGCVGASLSSSLLFGGTPGAAPYHVATELYNGTSWTELADSTDSHKYCFGLGTVTAALMAGGHPNFTSSEEWDGTSWTEGGALNTGRFSMTGGAGTQTAGLVAGGDNGSIYDVTETYNGSTWTEVNDLNTARKYATLGGASTPACILVGGQTPSKVANVETYDGTSWTETTDVNTARSESGGSIAGSSTDFLVFGGNAPSATDTTEFFNGTTWTETGDLATARSGQGGSGVTTSAISAGGSAPPSQNATEEFSVPSAVTVAQEGQVWYNTTSTVLKGFGLSVPAGSWASAPSLNTGRDAGGSAGVSNTSGLVFGGDTPATTVNTESFDGSAWTETGNLATATKYTAGWGLQTAAMIAGGQQTGASPPYANVNTETFDGTSWTAGGNINSQRAALTGAGSTTSGMIMGGQNPAYTPAYVGYTEQYDGSTWTEVADLNNGRSYVSSAGTSNTSALCFFGNPWTSNYTEKWDGTSWSEQAELNNTRSGSQQSAGQGTVTAALGMGGQPLDQDQYCEFFDGTSWSEQADLAVGSLMGLGGGTSTSAFYAGGQVSPGFSTRCEVWTAGTAIKTFTAS